MKKFVIKPTVPTLVTDMNIGTKVRLTVDSVDGHSTIQLNGVYWSVKIIDGGELSKGSQVVITGNESNTFLVIPDKEPDFSKVNFSLDEELKKDKPSPKNPMAGLEGK